MAINDWTAVTPLRKVLLGTSPSEAFRAYGCMAADPSRLRLLDYNGVIDSIHLDSIYSNTLYAFYPGNRTLRQLNVSNWSTSAGVGTPTLQLSADLLTPTMPDRHPYAAYCPDDDNLYFFGGLHQTWSIARAVSSGDITPGTGSWAMDTTPLGTGEPVIPTTSGSLPAELTSGATYYLIRDSSSACRLASSYANAIAGTAITYSGAGTGTHTLTRATSHPNDIWKINCATGAYTQIHVSNPFHAGLSAFTPSVCWDPTIAEFVISNLGNFGQSSSAWATFTFKPSTNTLTHHSGLTVGGGTSPSIQSAQSMAFNGANGRIYAFGCGNLNDGGNELWEWRGYSRTWRELSPTGTGPSARLFHGTACVAGRVIVHGGAAGDAGSHLTDTFAYNPATNAWSEIVTATTPTAAKFTYMAALGNKLYMRKSASPSLPWYEMEISLSNNPAKVRGALVAGV